MAALTPAQARCQCHYMGCCARFTGMGKMFMPPYGPLLRMGHSPPGCSRNYGLSSMYEQRKHRLLSWGEFLVRAGRHALAAALILFGGVGIGTLGYRVVAGLNWVDAFLNASMISSGMGPVDRMDTAAAKVFSALYALFSGLVYVGVVSVTVAPWLHRLFHWIHVEEG